MILSLLLLVMGVQDASQADINRLESEVRQLSSELTRTQTMVQEELRPMCSAESRIQEGELRVTNEESPVRVNLFGIVSSPAATCLPAEIRISATYFDPTGNFVCSGSTTISQTAAVQNTFVEFRPYQPEVFLKWWDGPTLRQLPLLCKDYQGNELRNPTDYAVSLRIWATVAPHRGGLATSEIQIALPRAPRRQ